MVIIEAKGQTLRVNNSKLRKNPDDWHDVVIPGLEGRDGTPTVPGEPENSSTNYSSYNASQRNHIVSQRQPALWIYSMEKVNSYFNSMWNQTS